jgi:hypothetical protein
MSEWISVGDELHKSGVEYLTLSEGGVISVSRYWSMIGKWLNCDARVVQGKAVTHWMPLPEPPKEKS